MTDADINAEALLVEARRLTSVAAAAWLAVAEAALNQSNRLDTDVEVRKSFAVHHRAMTAHGNLLKELDL